MTNKELLKRITKNPEIMGGKAVIRGMRIGVDTILHDLACGYSFDQIIEQHPIIDANDIKACLIYAEEAVEKMNNKVKKSA